MENGGLFPIALDAVVLECSDVAALSGFYLRLLGWQPHYGDGVEWADIVAPKGGAKLAFQRNEAYAPPVWPDEPNAQQQMAHLDFTVRDAGQMRLAVEHALACGARLACEQYGEDQWTTLLDPAGHPFCLCRGE